MTTHDHEGKKHHHSHDEMLQAEFKAFQHTHGKFLASLLHLPEPQITSLADLKQLSDIVSGLRKFREASLIADNEDFRSKMHIINYLAQAYLFTRDGQIDLTNNDAENIDMLVQGFKIFKNCGPAGMFNAHSVASALDQNKALFEKIKSGLPEAAASKIQSLSPKTK